MRYQVTYRITYCFSADDKAQAWAEAQAEEQHIRERTGHDVSHAEPQPALKAHVVAWRYGDRSSAPDWQGGGFDWYYTPEEANEAFEREKQNADELSSEGWTAYRFDYEPAYPRDATAEIDLILDDLCDNAPFRYPR